MNQHLPVLIVFFPLAASILAVILGRYRQEWAGPVVMSGIAASFYCSLSGLITTLRVGPISYELGGWSPPWGIEYVLDPLSGVVALLVTFVALLVSVYMQQPVARDFQGRSTNLYALFALLVSGLLGMTITGDVFNLYVHLEVASLAAYALVAAGGARGSVAAFRYLILGTLGGTFYLLGIGYLYAATGTLNMADLASRIALTGESRAVVMAIGLIVTGLGIKMALFPMHGWMPDAYTYSPPALTAFIAGVMGKVSIYALFRLLFFVMGGAQAVQPTLELLGVLAGVAILVGSVMAIAQGDLRRMLAYSSVGQVGYIVLGFSLGNQSGLIGGLLHMINHGVMKTCLFFIAGGLAYRIGEIRMPDLLQASRRMPVTMALFVLVAFSMVGLPPTAGFFSKWYLIKGAMEAGSWHYIVVILVSSLMSAIYFFRVIEHAYFKKAQNADGTEVEAPPRQELPPSMLLPITILGLGVLFLGLFSESIVSNILVHALPGGH